MGSLFNLAGKTALITGGARGIGAAMATALAEAGADIILIQRDPSNTTTKSAIEALKRQCVIHIADLSIPTSVTSIIPSLTSDPASLPNSGIHILVNCAGIQRRHSAAEFLEEDWNDILQTNLSTVFKLCKDVGVYWITNSMHGRIINVASLLSYQGGIRVPAYAAAKHGVQGLTKALSNEWAGIGIGVNAVAPGYIATDMNTALISDTTRSGQIMERIPAGRWGTPEDFAGVVVFLASERASGYVSGETVVVDGGWMGR